MLLLESLHSFVTHSYIHIRLATSYSNFITVSLLQFQVSVLINRKSVGLIRYE